MRLLLNLVKMVVCWCPDQKSVIVWDVASGGVLRELQSHTNGLTRVCFNGDASRILSGSLDTTARIWDVSSGECMLVVHVHNRT